MTNPYYTDNFSGQPGQTARAESVASEYSGIQAGFDAVYAAVLGALRSGTAGEIIVALPNAAARANKFLKFDASGNPSVVNTPLNVRGVWTASTAYSIGDAYNAAPNNSLYYVKTAYTSGATFGSTDLANTTILVDLAGLFFVNNVEVLAGGTYSLSAGDSRLVDTTSGNVTFTLPASPVIGDSPINITHIGGSLTGSQLLTITSGSNYIMGNADNTLSVNVANASMTLMWAGVPYGWRLRTMG